jgi:hypothetical protein
LGTGIGRSDSVQPTKKPIPCWGPAENRLVVRGETSLWIPLLWYHRSKGRSIPILPKTRLLQSRHRACHCEERSDEAIPKALQSSVEIASPPMAARNDNAENGLSRYSAAALLPKMPSTSIFSTHPGALANIQQLVCVDTSVSEVTVGKITDAYAACADRFANTYLNEMRQQGWE